MGLEDNEKNIRKKLQKVQNAVEREILVNYKMALDEMRIELTKLYERYSSEGTLSFMEMAKYDRLKRMHEQISLDLNPYFRKNATEINKFAELQFHKAYYGEWWAVEQEVGVAMRLGFISKDTIRAAVQNPISGLTLKETLEQNRKAIILDIRRQITQGLVRGESYTIMSKRIKGTLQNDAKKAILVARTEGQRAVSEGLDLAHDSINAAGVFTDKLWISTLDGKTRPSHQSLDGQKADSEGFFTVQHKGSRVKTRGPLLSGIASFDIRCRCTLGEIITGYEPKYREARDEGKIPYVTYDAWAKAKQV